MPDAVGINAQLLGKTESSFGQAPVGNFAKLPFVSCGVGSTQGLIKSDVLGLGRDPAAPARDVINVDGPVVVPLDLRNIGQWLTWLFGAPTTTGAGPYDHEFHSGAGALPSFALELGMPDAGVYFLETGLRADKMQLQFQRSGLASATFEVIGQSEERSNATAGGTPTVATFSRFNQFQGGVKKDGVALGNIVSANLTFANNLERQEVIRSDGKIAGTLPGETSLTGAMTVRFSDTVLLALAEAGTPCELEFAYTMSANAKLVLTVHEVHLPKPKNQVSGPGGVQASYDWQAAKETAAGRMLTAILTNDVSSYS
jgi:hypothetical protein